MSGAPQIDPGGGPEPLQLYPLFEFGGYVRGTACETLLDLHLQADAVPDEVLQNRPPLEIIAVIDTSGSMAGAPLDLCKATLRMLTDLLDDRDTLGLVTFNHAARNLGKQSMTDEGKAEMRHSIKSMYAGGGTQISSGLLMGLGHLCAWARQGGDASRAVFILTDGQTKESATAIVSEMRGYLLPSMRVFSFGYGAHHSAELLQAVSEAGGGMYCFIEKNEDVGPAFASCLGGLMSVVARDVKATVKLLTDSGASLLGLASTGYAASGPDPSSELTVDVGDIYAGETKDLLFRVSLGASVAPPCLIGTARVTFTNAITNQPRSLTGPLGIGESPGEANDRPNPTVLSQRLRLDVVSALQAALSPTDAGAVCERLGQVKGRVEIALAMLRYDADASVLLRGLLRDLQRTADMLRTRDVRSHATLMSSLTAHRSQRSNSSGSYHTPHMRTMAAVGRTYMRMPPPMDVAQPSGAVNQDRGVGGAPPQRQERGVLAEELMLEARVRKFEEEGVFAQRINWQRAGPRAPGGGRRGKPRAPPPPTEQAQAPNTPVVEQIPSRRVQSPKGFRPRWGRRPDEQPSPILAALMAAGDAPHPQAESELAADPDA